MVNDENYASRNTPVFPPPSPTYAHTYTHIHTPTSTHTHGGLIQFLKLYIRKLIIIVDTRTHARARARTHTHLICYVITNHQKTKHTDINKLGPHSKPMAFGPLMSYKKRSMLLKTTTFQIR